MTDTEKWQEAGKEDAEKFIRDEAIDYDPFVALSDMHLVRKTCPVQYDAFRETVSKHDEELWKAVDAAALKRAETADSEFSYDDYARGFVEGVAAVWDKIRDEVLRR